MTNGISLLKMLSLIRRRGCLNGGFTMNTHNDFYDLVRELNSILRYAGYHTKLEEEGIFVHTVMKIRGFKFICVIYK